MNGVSSEFSIHLVKESERLLSESLDLLTNMSEQLEDNPELIEFSSKLMMV